MHYNVVILIFRGYIINFYHSRCCNSKAEYYHLWKILNTEAPDSKENMFREKMLKCKDFH